MTPDPPRKHDVLSPAEHISTDTPGQEPAPGIGLCLSGGGYRAMLFHVGVLWRLNEAGYLGKLARISSVSGGSITAGMLGVAWKKLDFQSGVARAFQTEVVAPLRRLAGRTIDAEAVIGGLVLPGTIGDRIADAYRKYLFGNATLQDLPNEPPRFVFNATSVQTGDLWRFAKPFMADYRVGMVVTPTIELAAAVGASSAFPPVLSPVALHLDVGQVQATAGADLHREPYTTQVLLTDGGVYDNLGLETVWKVYQTILVSDAGGKMQAEDEPAHDWARHSLRVFAMVDNQVRSLRKRQLIESFRQGIRQGAYWGIRTNIEDYGLADVLAAPFDRTQELANLPTRLQRLEAPIQERLINWGYAVSDAALRAHVDTRLPKGVFPYSREI